MTPSDQPEPFERLLSATPHRELPPEWRVRILTAAHRVSPTPWRHRLAGILWPHPLAWGAVAAAWLVIAGLNFSGPCGETLYAVTPPEYRDHLPSAGEYLAQLQTEHRLLASLANDAEFLAEVRRHSLHRLRPEEL